ncbi:MAG: hypothetical protein P1P84_02645 [Deferrisomatales bacterium]|nr:hypothetical protein [Deferrisomatales bacterium]
MPLDLTHVPDAAEREHQGNRAMGKALYQILRAIDAELAALRTAAGTPMTPQYSAARARLVAIVQRIGG